MNAKKNGYRIDSLRDNASVRVFVNGILFGSAESTLNGWNGTVTLPGEDKVSLRGKRGKVVPAVRKAVNDWVTRN